MSDRKAGGKGVAVAGVPPQWCTLAIDGTEQEQLVAMFKALGNPLRFEALKFLLTHEGCITGDIVSHLPLAQSTVSQHLKVLRDAGWIRGTVDGPATNYCIDDDRVQWFREVVGRVF